MPKSRSNCRSSNWCWGISPCVTIPRHTACARVRVGLAVKPLALERLERHAGELARESRALERDRDEAGWAPQMDERLQVIVGEQAQLAERQARLQGDWLVEKRAVERVLDLRAQLGTGDESAVPISLRGELEQACADLHALQGQSPQVFSEVTAEVIAQVVSQWTGVPLGQIHRQGPQIDLATPLRQRIYGQAPALEAVVQVLAAAQVGLRDPRQEPLQPYRHDNLSLSFNALLARVRQLLNGIDADAEMRVRLQLNEGHWEADLPQGFFAPRHRYYLLLRGDGEALPSLAQGSKLGACGAIEALIRRALPGVELIALPAAPQGLPQRAGSTYWRLEPLSDAFEALQHEGRVALFMPGPAASGWAELIAVGG